MYLKLLDANIRLRHTSSIKLTIFLQVSNFAFEEICGCWQNDIHKGLEVLKETGSFESNKIKEKKLNIITVEKLGIM